MSLMTQVGLEFIARNRSQAGMKSFESSIRRTQHQITYLSRSLLGLAGMGGGLYTLGSVLRSSRSEFANYEKGLAKVSTQLDAHTMHYMPTYRAELMKMSAEYGQAKTALTEGLFDILSATIAPSEALKVLDSNIRSATGGFTDAAIATKANIRVLKAYNYETDQVNRINDIMHGTVKQGIMTFEEYASSIGNVLGTAAFLKVDFEAVGASMAAMTRSGLDANKSIVALKNILNQFIYPTEEVRQVARELGFELDETSIRGSGLITIIDKLSGANERQLKVLMPSIRGMAGFAGQLKNAAGLARGYAENLESAGRMQSNFAKAAETDSFKISQANEKWSNFKITIGELISPTITSGLNDLTNVLEDHSEEIREYLSNFREGIVMAREIQAIVQQISKPWWLLWYEGIDLGIEQAGIREFQTDRPWVAGQREADLITEREKLNRRLQETGPKYSAASAENIIDEVAIVKRTNADILADTREHLASVRSMHDKTRMEKIQILRQYVTDHSDELDRVAEAERLVSKEIIAIEKSRVDAMAVYTAELREDMENSSLYIKEKFAEAARTIENSMSGAFESMIADGMSWREAMNQFFTDVGRAFAKMAADMAARAIMFQAMNLIGGGMNLIGGGMGLVGGMFMHSGGIVGTDGDMRMVPAPAFAGAPRLHQGLSSDEYPAILQRGEQVIPRGGGRSIVIERYINIESVQTYGPKDFEEALANKSEFLANLHLSEVRNNHMVRKLR